MYEANNKTFPKDTTKIIQARKEPWMVPANMEAILAFIAFARTNAEKYGAEALATTPAMDDLDVLRRALPFISSHCACKTFVVLPRLGCVRCRARQDSSQRAPW